jgi:glycosyltransferase involved in cell wall biosynthesis
MDEAQIICTSSNTTKNKINELISNKYEGAITVIKHAVYDKLNGEKINNKTKELDRKYKHILRSDYFIVMSNTSIHKNLEVVIKALPKLKVKKDYKIVFIGHGTDILTEDISQIKNKRWYSIRLYGLAKRLKLRIGKDVIGLGYIPVEDKYHLLKKAKALIMPSFAEGGGSYPIEESIDLGIPIITSDIPVIRETLKDHSAEVLWFDPYSQESLVNTIHVLESKYDYYKASIENDRRLSELTWEGIKNNYIKQFYVAIEKWKNEDIEPDQLISSSIEVKGVKFRIRDYLDKVLKIVKFLLPYGFVKKYLQVKSNKK